MTWAAAGLAGCGRDTFASGGLERGEVELAGINPGMSPTRLRPAQQAQAAKAPMAIRLTSLRVSLGRDWRFSGCGLDAAIRRRERFPMEGPTVSLGAKEVVKKVASGIEVTLTRTISVTEDPKLCLSLGQEGG